MPHSLDAIDRQIVALLVRDGRAGAAQISRTLTDVSERSVRYRVERLLRDGVIRVSAVVNPHAIGFDVIADVFIEVAPGEVDRVARRRLGYEQVSYVAASIGKGDLSIQVCARDADELERIVDKVVGIDPGVLRTNPSLPRKLKTSTSGRSQPGVREGWEGGERSSCGAPMCGHEMGIAAVTGCGAAESSLACDLDLWTYCLTRRCARRGSLLRFRTFDLGPHRHRLPVKYGIMARRRCVEVAGRHPLPRSGHTLLETCELSTLLRSLKIDGRPLVFVHAVLISEREAEAPRDWASTSSASVPRTSTG